MTAIITTAIYHTTQKAKIHCYQARRYFEQGAFAQAIPLYQKCLAAYPSREEAVIDLANAYRWNHNFPKAIALLERAISMKAGSAGELESSLADTYVWNRQYDAAVVLYRKLLRENPSDRTTQKKLAEVYVWQQEFGKAGDILSGLLEDDPEDPEVQLLFAKVLHYSGDTKEAIKLYEKLLKEHAGP